MFSFLRGSAAPEPAALPLFPLKTVLFPGGVLPLKVFEQRYIAMTKACLRDEQPFGVCLLTRGEEVATRTGGAGRAGASGTKPECDFEPVGTLARIVDWEMPQLGILHLRTEGGTRFRVQEHAVTEEGLVVGRVTGVPPEPAVALPEAYQPLARLLEAVIARAGAENFPATLALGDASWVGYRLAEVLPLPLPIKQRMLEINDSEVRLEVLAQFLKQQGLL